MSTITLDTMNVIRTKAPSREKTEVITIQEKSSSPLDQQTPIKLKRYSGRINITESINAYTPAIVHTPNANATGIDTIHRAIKHGTIGTAIITQIILTRTRPIFFILNEFL
jgi:hypothetical protein